jgi:cell wall-associated NlpC family hydrolase
MSHLCLVVRLFPVLRLALVVFAWQSGSAVFCAGSRQRESFAVHLKLTGRPIGRGAVAAAALVATVASLVIAAPGLAGAKPTPPPNPTNGQISAAQSAKQALASRVGALSGQIAQAQVELDQLKGKAELAEQKYAFAYSKLQIANQKAIQAQNAVFTAQVNVEKAHARFVQYVQATYMSGDIDGTAGTLLTATDPSALLEQSALEQYQQQHQVDAIGALQTATVAKSNADAKARQTVLARKKAAADANAKRVAARNAYNAQQQQKAALVQSMAASQHELDVAQEQLATLNHQRTAYLAYQAEQARLARIRAEKLRKERLRRAEEARRARERRNQQSGGSSGGTTGPPPPSGGNWTAAKGRKAAKRALSQLGDDYAWAGGGADGPSRGVCDPSNGAPNDCYVVGFDCSGLAMYAWGASWWAHYAASQYSQAGSYHPSAGNLLAGDLIFWSSNGRVSGIHHVAIYIGGGDIVEAPYSGGYVQTASVYEYGSFFGATRPLT